MLASAIVACRAILWRQYDERGCGGIIVEDGSDMEVAICSSVVSGIIFHLHGDRLCGGVEFVLEDALLQVAGDPDVESAGRDLP